MFQNLINRVSAQIWMSTSHYRRNSSQECLDYCATTLLLQERQSAWCERTGQWRVNHYRCLWGDGDVNPKPCDTLINHSADRNKHTLFRRQPNKTAFSASKQSLQRVKSPARARREDVLSAGGADFRRARRFRLRARMRSAAVCAPTALDRRSAGEEMGGKRQKLRRSTTKRRGKHHQKLPHSVHSHSSNAPGVFSQKATPVGETRLCWSTATAATGTDELKHRRERDVYVDT